MGIHICLLDKSGKDVEEWDYIRQGKDHEFLSLLYDLDTYHPEDEDSEYFRPKDVKDLIKSIDNWDVDHSKLRYYHLCWLLRKSECWLYISH